MRAREQTERGMKERKPSAKEGRKEEQYHATCREYDDLVLVTVMYSHCNLRVAPVHDEFAVIPKERPIDLQNFTTARVKGQGIRIFDTY